MQFAQNNFHPPAYFWMLGVEDTADYNNLVHFTDLYSVTPWMLC